MLQQVGVKKNTVLEVGQFAGSAPKEGGATTQGTVQRVRVGPFATRAAADAGLAKLKAAGYASAIVKSPQ